MSDQTNVPPLPGKDTYTRERMQKIARLVDEELPSGWAFIVLAMPMGESEGRVNYASNGCREDVINLLTNFLQNAKEDRIDRHSDKTV